MDVKLRTASNAACIGLALLLGACSSGSALTTGTLLGGSTTAATPAAPPPETSTDRALHVAATSARAVRCGYVFDPGALRQGYLAFEAQQGGAADQVAKAEKSYDYTTASIAKSIAANDDYCSEEQTATIKRDLNLVLTGNYSTTSRKSVPNVGWWNARKSDEPINREKLFNPER